MRKLQFNDLFHPLDIVFIGYCSFWSLDNLLVTKRQKSQCGVRGIFRDPIDSRTPDITAVVYMG